ncbi:ATP-grasp domain-containing protein [Nocardia veterana]|uniref:ATP-grasp domain-containing protein n=1 Tax=Nocardia veterana TaxID=132249 RepID=A0A7X6RG32_9NOCA|nr:ATP-grasp domain-containing protein [Nocardia veterana]NKY84712.1 ATP-grasp domain-containing protein [Nocardia veterana]
MVTVLVATRPQLVAPYLPRIDGPVHCLIPAGTEHLWRAAGVTAPLHTVGSWSDYTALAAAVAPLPVTRIISTDEITIAAAGFLRTRFGVAGQGWEQALAFTDKATMKRRLAEAGISVTGWGVARSFDEASAVADRLGWPVVVKPRRGFGALGTTKVETAQQMSEFAAAGRFTPQVGDGDDYAAMLRASGVYDALDAAPDGFLVERCVDAAAEYSCDMVVVDGERRFALTTRYPTTILDAVGSGRIAEFIGLPADDPEAESVEALTTRAIAVLGLRTGQVHCEIFRTRSGDYLLGEIACRAGGAGLPMMAQILFGINTIAAGVEIAVGRDPGRPTPRAYRSLVAVGVPLANGLVIAVPTVDQLRAIPGVAHADLRVRVGETYGGSMGSCAAAAYLYFEPQPGELVDLRMDDIRAAAAALFTVVPEHTAALDAVG